jgi:hypothetical protein
LPEEVSFPQPKIPSNESKSSYYDYRYGWNNCGVRAIYSKCATIDQSLFEICILPNSRLEILNRIQEMTKIVDSDCNLIKEEFLLPTMLKVSALSPSLYFANKDETNPTYYGICYMGIFEYIAEMTAYSHELVPKTIFPFKIDNTLFSIFNECLGRETILDNIESPFEKLFAGRSMNIKIHFLFIEYLILFLKESSFQMVKEKLLKNFVALNKSICSGAIRNVGIDCLFIHFISLRAILARIFPPMIVAGLYQKALSDLKTGLIKNPKTDLETAMYCIITDSSLDGMNYNSIRLFKSSNIRCLSAEKTIMFRKNSEKWLYKYLKKYLRSKRLISHSYLNNITCVVNDNFIKSMQNNDKVKWNQSPFIKYQITEREKSYSFRLLILMFRENAHFYLDLIRQGISQRKADILFVFFTFHVKNSEFWRFTMNDLLKNLLTPEQELDLFRNLKELLESDFDFTLKNNPALDIYLPLNLGIEYILEWVLLWLESNNRNLTFENFKIISQMVINKDLLNTKYVFRAIKQVEKEVRQKSVDYLTNLLFDGIFTTSISVIPDMLTSFFGLLTHKAIDCELLVKSIDFYLIGNISIDIQRIIDQVRKLHELKLQADPNDIMFLNLKNNLKDCLNHRLKEVLYENSSGVFLVESLYPRMNERFETPFNSVQIVKDKCSNRDQPLGLISKFSIGKIDESRRLFGDVLDWRRDKAHLIKIFRSCKLVSRYLKNEYQKGPKDNEKWRQFLIYETLPGLFNVSGHYLKFSNYFDHYGILQNDNLEDLKDFRVCVRDFLGCEYQNNHFKNPKIKSPISMKNLKSFTGGSFRVSNSKKEYILSEACLLLNCWNSSNLDLYFRASQDSTKTVFSPDMLVGKKVLELRSRRGSKFLTIRTRTGFKRVVTIKFKFIA